MFVCNRFHFTLEHPLVMGIVNVTPDSFSDGGSFAAAERAIEHGLRLREDGADILDVGGESTRPGATPIEVQLELDRVLPVLAGLLECGAALSVDTMKPQVMAAVLMAGADMINDVNALSAPGALEAVAASDCGVCLMHMQGSPRTMQVAPQYHNVVAEVLDYLRARIVVAEHAGIARERLVVDPGFGFGKTSAHNLSLFRHLGHFAELAPLLVGVSRKSLFGVLTQRPVQERLVGSVTAAMLAAMKGAAILRVHDVAATVDALKVMHALAAEQ